MWKLAVLPFVVVSHSALNPVIRIRGPPCGRSTSSRNSVPLTSACATPSSPSVQVDEPEPNSTKPGSR
jgi:hypothetical protein